MTLHELVNAPQYSLQQIRKEAALIDQLNQLTKHHCEACPAYARLVSILHHSHSPASSLEEVPYVPVGLFKTHALLSIPQDRVFRTLTSSGTSGQQVSHVFLDQETASRQTAALNRIMTHLLGDERIPMLLIDTGALFKDRKTFSARGAGVLGMMTFGRNHLFVLEANMDL